ncbi:hypothetical protein F4X86_02270 [Candidatus Saccharibacteria bacterium]|nr:hypothetical protein [Candidatus Saccharibacteria bacterium]
MASSNLVARLPLVGNPALPRHAVLAVLGSVQAVDVHCAQVVLSIQVTLIGNFKWIELCSQI